LTVEGRVYGLGNNQYGQLGIGHKVNECQPTLIRELGKVLQVSAGYHSGAIDENGDLYLWGSGSFGEILRPKKFVLSAPVRYVSIGGFFGVAYGDNRLFTWGNNISGQLGTGNYEPTRAPQEVTQMRKYTIDEVVTGMNFVLITTSRKNYALND
jgi:X-linked retinitis pigmentosa GTPase regulator